MTISISNAIKKIFSENYNKKGLFAFSLLFILSSCLSAFKHTPDIIIQKSHVILAFLILVAICDIIFSLYVQGITCKAVNKSSNGKIVFDKENFSSKNILTGASFCLGILIYVIMLTLLFILIIGGFIALFGILIKLFPFNSVNTIILFATVVFALLVSSWIFLQFPFLNFIRTLKFESWIEFSQIIALIKSCKGQIFSYFIRIFMLSLIFIVLLLIPILILGFIIFTSPELSTLLSNNFTYKEAIDHTTLITTLIITILAGIICTILSIFPTVIAIEINAQMLRYSKLSFDSYLKNSSSEEDSDDNDDNEFN